MMVQAIQQFDFAQFLGLIWGAIWVWSMSLKSDQRLNQVWLGNNVIGIAHFVLLGAWVGAANCLVNIFRSGLYLAKDWRQSKYKYHMMCGLILLFTVISFFKFQGWSDILPLYASWTTCIAFFVLTGVPGRILITTGNAAWLGYAFVHQSYGGMLSQFTIIIISILTIIRMHRDTLATGSAL